MYSRFLEEAGYAQAEVAATAAERWTALADAAREASEGDQPEPARWRELTERTEAVLDAEQRLWSSLA
jgi:hypothetical protein